MADRVWTPQEAEEAFKTFGNFILQVNALYEKYGERTPENELAGTQQLVRYMEGLTTAQLTQIVGYFEYLETARENVLMLIGMVLLAREAGLSIYSEGGKNP
jgi:hypothetical protein